MKVYKLQNVKTGLFSCGGEYPNFTKEGKIWTSRRAVSNHISILTNSKFSRYRDIYKDEVVIIEYLLQQNSSLTLAQYDKQRRDDAAKRLDAFRARARIHQMYEKGMTPTEAQAMLDAIKDKFPQLD